jgi:putative sterol carrier protein
MADLAEVTARIRNGVGENSGLGKAIKLDFGADGLIYIDGVATPNTVTNTDAGAADATVAISFEDFLALAGGTLDPMMAFMQGKMKIQGDMMLVQRLAPLLKQA